MIGILIGGIENTAKLDAPADVAIGEFVEIGNAVLVAKAAGKSGETVSFGVGGGIYKVTEATAGGPTVGSPAYLDDSGDLKGDDGKHVGLTLAKTGDVFTLAHNPDGSTVSI